MNIPKYDLNNQPELVKAIENSKRILAWEDDWDGEGSKKYDAAVLERAIYFVVDNCERFYQRHAGRYSLVPQIEPGPDGSIDVYWHLDEFHVVLCNVPEDPADCIGYYGDKEVGGIQSGSTIKGEVCMSDTEKQYEIFRWLNF